MLSSISLAATAVVALALGFISYRVKLHPLSKYPGPLLAIISDLYITLFLYQGRLHIKQQHLHAQYGPVVRVGPNRLMFESSTALHDIYAARHVQKSAGYAAMNPIAGISNMHTSINKDLHRLKRKAVSPAFSDQFIRSFEHVILQHVKVFLRQLPQEATDGDAAAWSPPINMSERCKYFTIDVIGSFGFGRSFNTQTESTNHGILSGLKVGAIVSGIYGQCPELRRFSLHKYIKADGGWTQARHGQFMREMIEQRVNQPRDAQPDLFSFVIETKDTETGDLFKQNDLWAESRLFLVAGSDTSATVLSGVYFYLSRFPECRGRLEAEIRQTFASSADIRLGSKLSGCSYLRAVIDETMRMSPPAGIALWREVCEGGIMIDGHHVPVGTEVGVSLYSLFHSEQVFPESDTFIPERWLETGGRFADRLQEARAAFKPFSLGSRNCVGMNLAYAEMSLLLAKATWNLDFKRPDGLEDRVGQGSSELAEGRRNPDEFQLESYITSMHDGPFLQFKQRPLAV